MAKYFMTHSWSDIDFARRLCDDLRAHGLDGFFDAYSIRPGDKIPKEIQDGLAACDVYLPLLSRAAFRSDWCDEEINAALMFGKAPGRKGRPRIISLLIEECSVEMQKYPLLLQRLYIDFTKDYAQAFDLLLQGLSVSSKPKPSAPLSAPSATQTQPTQPKPVPPAKSVHAPPAPSEEIRHESPVPSASFLSRDELIHRYSDARALQSDGSLREAREILQKIVQDAPSYRDAVARLQKLDLYLDANDLMQQGLADKEDNSTPWAQAATRLEELLRLDAGFLDTRAKLTTCNHWLALAETYERLLDALEADDWAKAWGLFQQITSVKPTYKRTQILLERAMSEIIHAGWTKKVNERDGKEMLLVPAGVVGDVK